MSERTTNLTKKFICTACALSLVGVGVVTEMSEGSNEDTESAAMWQKYVNQAKIKVHTDEGHLEGYQTISCFMLGNNASALYSRFSPYAIAATEAYWLPLGI
ncbi:hypothetical protein SAMN02910356_00600 [Selenomonas sp. GACV-9]|uniref:hypothetical protein n=1 Tax=Selenomonas sp. GACV-9 TaxID=3158782 RepID=UPI0008DED9A9|nr:hypothetical protein SAMN02910356_00600 [Selenomonas ruminantium]